LGFRRPPTQKIHGIGNPPDTMFRDRLNRDTSSCHSICEGRKRNRAVPSAHIRKQLSNNLATDFVGRELLRTNYQIFTFLQKINSFLEVKGMRTGSVIWRVTDSITRFSSRYQRYML
jgi:hypothetical protein